MDDKVIEIDEPCALRVRVDFVPADHVSKQNEGTIWLGKGKYFVRSLALDAARVVEDILAFNLLLKSLEKGGGKDE